MDAATGSSLQVLTPSQMTRPEVKIQSRNSSSFPLHSEAYHSHCFIVKLPLIRTEYVHAGSMMDDQIFGCLLPNHRSLLLAPPSMKGCRKLHNVNSIVQFQTPCPISLLSCHKKSTTRYPLGCCLRQTPSAV